MNTSNDNHKSSQVAVNSGIGRYHVISSQELKELSTKDLLFKLKQCRNNLKGMREFIKHFGFNNAGLNVYELASILLVIKHSIHNLLSEISIRLNKL